MPSIVFMIGLPVTVRVSAVVEQERRREQMDSVGRLGDRLIGQVEAELSAARYLLLGIRGLFEGSDEVTRREFERYLQSVNLH
jgi:CHASE1-domain containing sensor protein